MANDDHTAQLMKGTAAWNAWQPSRGPSEVMLRVGGRMLSPLENKRQSRLCA
jgi:hypothetical protein